MSQLLNSCEMSDCVENEGGGCKAAGRAGAVWACVLNLYPISLPENGS